MKRVRAVWSGIDGSPYLSTMYFDADGSGVDAADCVDAMGTFFGNMLNDIHDGVRFDTLTEVVTINPGTGLITASEFVSSVGADGAATDDLLPTQTQLLARWDTGVYLDGRRIQGRTYVPGLTEAASTSLGIPSATVKAHLQAAIDELLDVGTTARACIWSRKNLEAQSIASGSPWGLWAVLRSRRPAA